MTNGEQTILHIGGSTFVGPSLGTALLHFLLVTCHSSLVTALLLVTRHWKVYEGVPKEAGSGIMAMGTDDEQTLLFVDRQEQSGTPDLPSDQVEAKLRQTYQDYRKISEEPFECDGQSAIRRTFTGILDGDEWHGVAVHVAHGNTVFGIIGLTSGETFEFQQAIFSKIIKTFHFLSPPSPTPDWARQPLRRKSPGENVPRHTSIGAARKWVARIPAGVKGGRTTATRARDHPHITLPRLGL